MHLYNVYISISTMSMQQTQSQEPKEMSSIRVSQKLRDRLQKIMARLTLEDVKVKSMEELINLMADAFEREREKSKK